MSDENKTEQVEATTTENVEVKQEQPVEQPQPKQVDIDKVVKDRLYRQEQKILNELGVGSLDDVKSAIDERRKAEEEGDYGDDDDGPLKISGDTIKLDFSDVHDLEKEKKLEPAIKLDIETLN